MFSAVTSYRGLLRQETASLLRFIPNPEDGSTGTSTKEGDNIDLHPSQSQSSSTPFSLTVEETLVRILQPRLSSLTEGDPAGVSLTGISVQGNRLYRLLLDVDIRWNAPGDLAPKVMIQIVSLPLSGVVTSGGWEYTVPHRISRSHPRLEATIFIPSQVELVQINLIVINNGVLAYQLDIHTMNCLFKCIYPSQELQISQTLPKPHGRSQQSSLTTPHHLLSIVNNHPGHQLSTHSLVCSALDSFVQHVYLLHLSTTPLFYTSALQQQLATYAIHSQLISLQSKDSLRREVSTTRLPHDPKHCAGCSYRQVLAGCSLYHIRKTAAIESTSLMQSLERRDSIASEEEMSQLMIQALENAILNGRESILLLRDDSMIHKDLLLQVQEHLESLPSSWSFLLLGSNQLERVVTNTDSNSSRSTGDQHFAAVNEENVGSAFAVMIHGQETIRSTLRYLQMAVSLKTHGLTAFNLFVMEIAPTTSFTWFPSLVIPHPQISIAQTSLARQYSAQLCNYQFYHPLYWNIAQDYVSLTPLPTVADARGSLVSNNNNSSNMMMDLMPRAATGLVHVFTLVDVQRCVSSSSPTPLSKVLLSLRCVMDGLKKQTYPWWQWHVLLLVSNDAAESNPSRSTTADEVFATQLVQAFHLTSEKDKINFHVMVRHHHRSTTTITHNHRKRRRPQPLCVDQLHNLLADCAQNQDWCAWHDLNRISTSWRLETQVRSHLWDERSRSAQIIPSKHRSTNSVTGNDGLLDATTQGMFSVGLETMHRECEQEAVVAQTDTLFSTVLDWKLELANLSRQWTTELLKRDVCEKQASPSINSWSSMITSLRRQLAPEKVYHIPVLLQCKLVQ